MATPNYKRQGQTAANTGGWLSRLGSVIGRGAPVYAGVGQPSSASGGYFGGGTPAYASVPVAPPMPNLQNDPCVMTCPIDPAELAAGNIAIVIPRQG